MAISLTCTGCRSTLKLRDELAGKKVRCPRCKEVLIVPEAEADAEEPRDDRVRAKTGKTSRVQRDDGAGRKKPRREEDDDPKPRGKPNKWQPCPRCGTEGPSRVMWTSWGSFYGPKLFSHVRCGECGYCYNGKSGRSNALAATLFIMVPLLGILGILGAVGYLLYQRGYATF